MACALLLASGVTIWHLAGDKMVSSGKSRGSVSADEGKQYLFIMLCLPQISCDICGESVELDAAPELSDLSSLQILLLRAVEARWICM